MTPGAILGLAAVMVVIGAFACLLLLAWFAAVADRYQRDLDGVEIEGDWLFDTVTPDHLRQSSHDTPGKGGDVGGGVGLVHGRSNYNDLGAE